ncbi:hypothetical protein C8F04DRAFT_1231713 [Mycena alexandri]|uniref:Uncharacterized protein n=1 Tax=Mycena alexandri TaxID=1745969 RepID=A0AAD6XBH8_9AGAR|nr:hypothetical protein C8F04DRAFT_1231713 [Mycena alexandri]
MSSILHHIQARTIRFSGSRCFNDRNQQITCPLSRVDLIAMAVLAGLFLLWLGLYLLCRCGCSCRRRRRANAITLCRVDVEASAKPQLLYTAPIQPDVVRVPPYNAQFDASTVTLVEPDKSHPATHPYSYNHHYVVYPPVNVY